MNFKKWQQIAHKYQKLDKSEDISTKFPNRDKSENLNKCNKIAIQGK